MALNDGYSITETTYQSLNDRAKSVVYQILAHLI